MQFEWDKGLETGITALDADHQGIFARIDGFFNRCNEGGESIEVIAVIDALDSYARKHFSYEERLQAINNYPGLAGQQKHHAVFIADVADLKSKLETEGPSKQLALIAKGKLIRWFSLHIKNMDKQFVSYLNERVG